MNTPNIKAFTAHGKNFAVCLPQVRTVKFNIFDIKEDRQITKLYTLAFPFTLFWLNKEADPKIRGDYGTGHKVAFSKTKDLSELYRLPMHDCYEDFAVCGLQSANCRQLAEEFWLSKFNVGDADYEGANYLAKSTMKNYRTWEKLTKVNPQFIMHPNISFGNKPIALETALKGNVKSEKRERGREDRTFYY
jgi:hypothetical protein